MFQLIVSLEVLLEFACHKTTNVQIGFKIYLNVDDL